MKANTNTPRFRIALSIAALWIVGAVGYGLHDGNFQRHVYLKAVDTEYRTCGIADAEDVSPKQAGCLGWFSGDSDFERFRRGDGFWEAFKFALLPPLALLLLVAFWHDGKRRSADLWQRYKEWVRGEPVDG